MGLATILVCEYIERGIVHTSLRSFGFKFKVRNNDILPEKIINKNNNCGLGRGPHPKLSI